VGAFIFFSLILCLASAVAARGQQLQGHWEGTMVREGAVLPVSFDIRGTGAELKVTFNSPTQRALGIPTRNATFTAPKIHFGLVGDATTIIFDGSLVADVITGEFRENEARGTFSIKRAAVPARAFTEQEVSFRNGEVTLAGTLLLPKAGGAHPATVFLHGSGAEARFASRFLAEYMADRGIAAIIYDKRGVGRSTGDWKQADFNDLASDAIAAINLLKTRKEIRADKIGVYGHSQGGMLAPLVATRSTDVAFVISAAGGAVPLYEAEVNSLVNQLREQGISNAEMEEAKPFIQKLVDVLRTGKGHDELDAAADKVRATKWYPMLQVPARDSWFWAFYQRIANYNAADQWARVTVPSLVIYGERDALVPVSRSIAAIERALGRAANKDHTILILPRASHTLNIGPEPGEPFEWSRLSPGYPELLTAWIAQRVK